MRFDNQLRHALEIIDTYAGDSPLHVWLKEFFRQRKQMGARDRRLLSTMVYGFYRLGHAMRDLSAGDRMLAALYLCNDQPIELLQHFRPDWDPAAPVAEKIAVTGIRLTDIFPWKEELSSGVDHEAFCLSFLRQPDLFVRVRPGHQGTVRQRLGSLPHEFLAPSAVRLPNGFRIEDHFTPDREVVIQDLSSQRVAAYLLETSSTSLPVSKEPGHFWDTCAASGGKSILMNDLYPGIEITVSDIRESILNNLRARFRVAGIERYRSFLIDLSVDSPPKSTARADLVLTDVPCTGSGTWSRTPEQLYFFQPQKIGHYAALQKKIVGHVVPHIAPDASYVYCTCSVFKKENEEMTTFIREGLGMRLERSGAVVGYDQRADTLFAARFAR
jgi:16S rRNA (cytosine967-C5)-methyltransferase